MKKSSVLISAFIMCLALVVAVVGISAAWFGDVKKLTSDEIVINSNRPTGQATIDIGSSSNSSISGTDKLTPAITPFGAVIGDVNGDKHYNSLSPRSLANKEANTLKTANIITEYATTVKVSFNFIYVGSTGGTGLKKVTMTLKSATLENPRYTVTDKDGNTVTKVNTSLTNYIEEFASIMTLQKSDGTPVTDTGVTVSQDGTVLTMMVRAGITYKFNVELFFAKVDEESDHALLDTTIFFNFEVEAVAK